MFNSRHFAANRSARWTANSRCWIAQLGGFLGRKRDGDPGVKTLWQGWRRLHDIALTAIASQKKILGNAHPTTGLCLST